MKILNFLFSQSNRTWRPFIKTSRCLSQKDRLVSDLKVFEPNREEMKKVFEKFDTDSDGKISVEELVRVLKALDKDDSAPKAEVHKREAEKMMDVVDKNHDGFIDFDGFMDVHRKGVMSCEILGAFRMFDIDGNGRIGANELFKALGRLGENCTLEECQRMVRALDSDGDGYVDIDEFMAMMTRTMKLVEYF
ncbi:probable calcium-binding protein CML23 [Amborella trichopoda]|nr:probable calcium-binding protein CML23 [Amborella trichopoda]|eukprot:XP_011629231.1 probable calcium-binding protein CML23 [Amborella trichopoda]